MTNSANIQYKPKEEVLPVMVMMMISLEQVAGGTASGKSTVCEKIMESLRQIDLENVERQVVI